MPDGKFSRMLVPRQASDNTAVRKLIPLIPAKDRAPANSPQGKFWKAKATPEPAAKVANTVRTLMPLPKNAGSLVMKKVKSNPMNSKSINDKEKAVMAGVVNNAYKRTGKLSGGTEYEDYKGTTDSAGFRRIVDAKNGRINPALGLIWGATDPAYRMATTTGRGSYYINPENREEIVYTDGYDFTNNMTQDKTGKLKEGYMKAKTGDPGVDRYRSLRRSLAVEDQGKSVASNNRIQFSLKSSDTSFLPLYNSAKRKGS